MTIIIFLTGFIFWVFALYTRTALFVYLALVMFVFCWVWEEGVHKAFRLIPAALCLAITAKSMYMSSIYGLNYYYYDFISAISALISVIMLVSMLPDKPRHRQRLKASS